MKFSIIIFMSSLLVCACNNSKKVTNEKNEEENNHKDKVINSSDEHPEADSSNTSPSDSSDLVITFSSRGEGINGNAVETLNSFIDEFESQYDVSIEFNINNWGREGEKDYCFNLENLNSKIKGSFIAESKGLLEEKNLVTITENRICSKK